MGAIPMQQSREPNREPEAHCWGLMGYANFRPQAAQSILSISSILPLEELSCEHLKGKSRHDHSALSIGQAETQCCAQEKHSQLN